VLCLDCSLSKAEFIANATLHDSLKRRKSQIFPNVANFLKEINLFVKHFILSDMKNEHLRITDEALTTSAVWRFSHSKQRI
jgi:hypothetical protein